MHAIHSFARRLHGSADTAPASATTPTQDAKATKGLVLDGGWGYDLMVAALDATIFRGGLRQMRHRTLALAGIQPGEYVLDVGCGTGTLALEAQRRVGGAGRVVGIDPSVVQIARARAKAARRRLPAAFETGVIEQLPFADETFDVVLSTLMMHHLPAGLKRQGLSEIARVLKPGGRLVIADFVRKQERQGVATHFHAGGSNLRELVALAREAGFTQVDTQEMPPAWGSAFPGAVLMLATNR